MRERIDKLRSVITLDSELNKIQDIDVLLENILTEARKVMNADAGSIYIRQGNELAVSYAQNDTLTSKLPSGEKLIYKIFRIPIDTKTISGYAAYSSEALNIPDVYKIPENAPYSYDSYYDKTSGYRTQSMLALPLKTNMGDILGVLQIINALDSDGNVRPFDSDDELVVTHFASNATVTLQRAQMTRAILLRMTKMAELRDPKETGPHVNRVAGYAVEIYDRWARKSGLPERQISRQRDNLRMAAMLHDVGKVAISDSILKKPGRFTPEERLIMEQHTLFGAQLFLDKQSEFDETAQIVALNHHENWDGSGYPGHIDLTTGAALKTGPDGRPLGKKGEEIPLFGRIVAIADVYDALRSQRVYKEAWSEEDTLEEVKKLSGSKFDPQLVKCFFDALPSIHTVSRKYEE
ncbi:GAF and HD-GYP domain-containing protein [Spirochaeta dissipatitropha]